MKRLEVIVREVEVPCYCCNKSLYGKTARRKKCKVCDGSGVYVETHYTYICNGIAVDSDTLK